MPRETSMLGCLTKRGNPWVLMPLALVGALVLCAPAAEAKNCDPEPTDMLISYQDPSIDCSLREAVGDQDLFRFDASANDVVRFVVAESEFDTTRPICLEIRDPLNKTIFPEVAPPKCGTSVMAEVTLAQSGRHTIIISTGSSGQTTYALTLLCLVGECSGSGLGLTVVSKGCGPCRVGDVAKFNVAVVNSRATRTVEMKVFVRFPDGSTIFNLVDRHHEEALAAGSTVEFDIPGVAVPPGVPAGTYAIEAALLDPGTGKTLARHALAVALVP